VESKVSEAETLVLAPKNNSFLKKEAYCHCKGKDLDCSKSKASLLFC
jgi:hypothetical protein